MQQPLALALMQAAPGPLDAVGNLRRLESCAMEAAAAGSHLLICPEMFLTGYAIGPAAVQQLAQPADGPWSEMVAHIAQRHGIAVVYGYPERGTDGKVYNAAQWIGADGLRHLNYRKTWLFGDLDRNQFSAAPASTGLFEYRGWKIGMLICYDVEFPESVRALACAGADLIVVPTANMPDYDFVAQTLVPARAYENQVFVAYANYMGAEGPVCYGGLSVVAGPDGAVLAQADRVATMLTATLDGVRLAAVRSTHHHLTDFLRQAAVR